MLFQRAVIGGDKVLRIRIVILSVGIDVFCAKVQRTAKQRIGHREFRCEHIVSHPVFGINQTIVLYLASLFNLTLLVVATAQIVKVPVNVQLSNLA